MRSFVSFPRRFRTALLAGAAVLVPGAARAGDIVQNPVDRVDPSVVQRQLVPEERRQAPPPALTVAPARSEAPVPEGPPIVAGAIRVDGATVLPPAAFAAAIEPYLGRPLGPDDLRALARDVATAARHAGFPLATAWVPAQGLEAGGHLNGQV